MVASFSPHRDAGGTLHLPSPTGIHHVHPSSAIHQLRRSLSRSPSKGSLLSRPNSPSAKHSHYISSPLSPSRRASQGNLFLVPTSSGSSPLAVPYPPSARMNRPSLRRNGVWQSNRPRTTPSSPAKRVLSDSRDQGNAVSMPSNDTPATGGKQVAEGSTTPPAKDYPSSSKPLSNDTAENSPAPKAPSRIIEKRGSANFGPFSTTSSPLKRSDGIMNLDQASLGSPSAKRRSLHGANFGPDFDVFDLANSGNSPDDPSSSNQSQPDKQVSSFPPPSPHFSSIPKRSSSLRKSTLQQRQTDRSIFSRPRANIDHGAESPPASPMVLRSRQRMSLDSHMSLASSREQPATSQGVFSTSSVPLFSQTNDSAQPRHAAHPLSRTITQSSSGSSLADDSPTHEPIHINFDRPKPVLNFSKSLPAGSTRPLGPSQLREASSNESSDSPFATPNNYKLVKPLPAAFMSTGLISKKNRNVDDIHNASIGSKNMPDTPCKRPTNMLPPVQKPSQNPVGTKARPTPQPSGPFATPFGRPEASAKPTPFSKGMGIFGSSLNNKTTGSRRGSFASVDGDNSLQSQSPSGNHDSQSTIESELPPTPTKQALSSRPSDPSSAHQHQPRSSHDTVSNHSGPCSSPLGSRSLRRGSPHTPQDHIFPPDPSGLSISAHCDQSADQQDFNSSVLPATPTAPREYYAQIGKRQSFQLSGYSAPDVDPCLTSRFEKVELIGTGEFSQVYRVSQSQAPSSSQTPFAKKHSPSNHRLEKVWAVKKSKQPFSGARDRQRRKREVEILSAVSDSDYVISYADSWEDNNHLYIQTEFCEEGSLDVFLSQVGLKARLDDFRIWKILLELSLGLKHIHDSGFIHLDLKPANILITFEGVLKIADFGMATSWPAAAGIEGEGDREYIGPEILMGRYDKPADVFALGLIIFEIAGNVELPDNGVSWQKLRNGDMSDVPSLTWSCETSNILRDASGNPLAEHASFEQLFGSDSGGDDFSRSDLDVGPKNILGHEGRLPQLARSGELAEPPNFMVDAGNDDALDKIVRWMISPNPTDRPVADQVVHTFGVQWVERRRRAGATIYEGNWGPADEIIAEDAEMIDV